MSIFERHKKLDAKRRFGGSEFRQRLKEAGSYKRFSPNSLNLAQKTFAKKSKIIFYAAAVLILAAAYYLFISSSTLVTQVSVSGNHQVETDQIQSALKQRRFILLSAGRATQILTTAIPNIKNISNYKRIWPNRISFEIEERLPGFVIESDNQLYMVDDEGSIIGKIEPGSQGKNLTMAQDQLPENFKRGQILTNPKLTIFILSMIKLWPAKIATPITEIKFSGQASQEVQFHTAAGYDVMFDTNRPASGQLTNLSLILTKVVGNTDPHPLAYIDMRLPKTAYICRVQSPCSQQDQPQPDEAAATVNH